MLSYFRTRKVRRLAKKGLIAGYKAMNNGGEHWVQGAMVESADSDTGFGNETVVYGREYGYDVSSNMSVEELDALRCFKPSECKFCAVGGFRFGLFGDPSDTYQVAICRENPVMAEAYSLGLDKLIEATGAPTYPHTNNTIGGKESAVIGWNDPAERTWDEIEQGFKAAAELI